MRKIKKSKIKPIKRIKMTELSVVYGVCARTIGYWRDGSPSREKMELFSAMKTHFYFITPEEKGGINLEKIEKEAKEVAGELEEFTKADIVDEERVIDLAEKSQRLYEFIADANAKIKNANE